MANINLLPWREKLREERKRMFLVSLVITCALALVMLFLGDRLVNASITSQLARNEYLRHEIGRLDAALAEIRRLREQKAQLTERMTVIQDLQGTRPVIVRLFDELVRTLPEGVHYTQVSRLNDTISLSGVAESNSRVSALMRALDDSDWFVGPDLRQVSALAEPQSLQQGARNQFQLTVQVTTPSKEKLQ